MLEGDRKMLPGFAPRRRYSSRPNRVCPAVTLAAGGESASARAGAPSGKAESGLADSGAAQELETKAIAIISVRRIIDGLPGGPAGACSWHSGGRLNEG